MSETSTPVAGWYPASSGDGRIQWWDGSQWTEHVGERAPQPGAAGGPAVPYTGAPRRLVAPAGTRPYTPFIWIMAAFPLAGAVSGIALAFVGGEAVEPLRRFFSPTNAEEFLAQLVWQGVIGLTLLLLLVGLAILDSRAVKAAAVPSPFHWAWAFFDAFSIPVYLIGRSIVARRRTGSGLAPVFLYFAPWILMVAAIVVIVIVLLVGFSDASAGA